MATATRTATPHTVTSRQRLLAVLALAADLALVVALLAFLLNNGGMLLLALVGLAVAVGGGWWMVTEQMPRRGFGIAGLVAGFALIVVALFRAAASSEQPFLRIAIVAVLLAVAEVAARARSCPTCTPWTSSSPATGGAPNTPS